MAYLPHSKQAACLCLHGNPALCTLPAEQPGVIGDMCIEQERGEATLTKACQAFQNTTAHGALQKSTHLRIVAHLLELLHGLHDDVAHA